MTRAREETLGQEAHKACKEEHRVSLVKEFYANQMATPPSSPPAPPLTNSTSHSPFTMKRTRKAIWLRSLATRPIGAERPLFHVDLATRKADGSRRKKLRTYLGIVARDKVDVTYENWKQVPVAQKDLIWEDIQDEKENTLDRGEAMETVQKWALAAGKDSVDDVVCEKYDISKEKWTQFCQSRRDPLWEDVQKKAQAIQKQNTAPHVLCCGSYEFLENKLMEEKKKKQLEEAAKFGSTDTLIDPPSPIRRHVKWKMTRTKKIGQMISEAAKEIADKIDVLTAAIGRPEHPGRVCVAGADVTIKQYFGLTPRTSRASSSIASEDLEQLMQKIRDQLEDSIIEKGLALPPEPEVGLSTARVSTKESCMYPSGNDPDTGDSEKWGLYIKENPPRLVALGRLYEGSTTIHDIHLRNDQVKVGVEEVRDADAPIPVPTQEVQLVGHTLNTFVASARPAKPTDRPDHDVDDSLYLMTLNIPQLFLKPLHITETSMQAGNFDVYGFLEPQSIQRSGPLEPKRLKALCIQMVIRFDARTLNTFLETLVFLHTYPNHQAIEVKLYLHGGNNLVPLDLEIEVTCRRNNAAKRKRELQENQEPSSSLSSSSFPHSNFEEHIMVEDRPQRITVEDYYSTSTPQFHQFPDKSLSEALERLHGLLRKTPTQGFSEPVQLNIFIDGLRPHSKHGKIKLKTPDEAMKLIENMAARGHAILRDRAYILMQSYPRRALDKRLQGRRRQTQDLYWFGNNPCLHPVPKQPLILEISNNLVKSFTRKDPQGMYTPLFSLNNQKISQAVSPLKSFVKRQKGRNKRILRREGMKKKNSTSDLIPIDLEINATCRRHNSERIRNFLQDLEVAATLEEEPQSSEASSKQVTHEVNYMGNQPRNNFNAVWTTIQPTTGTMGEPSVEAKLHGRNNKGLVSMIAPQSWKRLAQFMQVSMSNQKSTESAIKNLEVQVGQLTKQLADRLSNSFTTNTEKNPKEECKAVMTRSRMATHVDERKDEKKMEEHKQQLAADPTLKLVNDLVELEEIVEEAEADFVVIDIEEDADIPLILGRPFMSTASCVVDMGKKILRMGIEDQKISFDLFQENKDPPSQNVYFKVHVMEEKRPEKKKRKAPSTPTQARFDRSRFISQEAWERYTNILLPERNVVVYYTEFDEFKEELKKCHWDEKLTDFSDSSIDIAIMKEFYANLYDPDDKSPKQVRVKGHLVKFDDDTLNTFLKTPVVLEEGENLCTYSRFALLRPDP
ncbi:hypothetical protein HKD37_01G001109 [Glycine soja]